MLIKNLQEIKYHYLDIFNLRHFSEFNKNQSWKEGDVLLSKTAALLTECYAHSLVFRVYGDDFAVLSKKKEPLEELTKHLKELFEATCIELQHIRVDLEKMPISSLEDIMGKTKVNNN